MTKLPILKITLKQKEVSFEVTDCAVALVHVASLLQQLDFEIFYPKTGSAMQFKFPNTEEIWTNCIAKVKKDRRFLTFWGPRAEWLGKTMEAL